MEQVPQPWTVSQAFAAVSLAFPPAFALLGVGKMEDAWRVTVGGDMTVALDVPLAPCGGSEPRFAHDDGHAGEFGLPTVACT